MLVTRNTLLLAAVTILLTACHKNSATNSGDDTVVYETTSNNMIWTASGFRVGGQDIDNVIIDVPDLTTISYTYLAVDEKYSTGDWEATTEMDPATAVNNNNGRNIFTVDASRGRTIRVYNFRRRGGPVSIRIRAHRRR